MKLLCRVILIGSVASLAIAPGLAAAKDPPPATVTLHIAAQSVGDALSEFAKQSGLQVVLYTEVAQGLVAPALEGTFTSLEALGRILAGTNLEYEFINPHTVAVRKKAGAAGQAGPPSTSRLAPANERAATLVEGGSPPAAPAPPRSVEPDAGMKTKSQSRESILEEVVITGSRIPEIPGQSVQPVRRYSRQDIERSGETTLTDFLNRLPDVSVSGSETIVASNSSFTGQTTVQLHGLPVGTTLVLLNGRRV